MPLKYVNGNEMKSNKKNLLDQYFTKKDIAKKLFLKAKDIISKYDNIAKYWFLEPSVGEGCFFDFLPKNKRIGIDIDPKREDILKKDYLKYTLPNKPLIVIGNPPFGHRGVLALEFINHSKQADYVCFILPMFFDSVGKGSIKYRIKHFNLIHSEIIPKNSFYLPKNNTDVDVKCVFQIWSKKHKNNKFNELNWYTTDYKKYDKFIKIYTVSLAKKRECGKEWIFNK